METESLGALHWLALGLVVATGLLHGYAGLAEGRAPLVLAGVGFFVAAGLFLVDYRRRLPYPLGVGHTGFQIVAWAVVAADQDTLVGYVDKVVQVELIAVLVVLNRRAQAGVERAGDERVGESVGA